MAKRYTGSLNLEWYNKQKSILLSQSDIQQSNVIPAPIINWVNKDEALFYEIIDNEGRGLKPYWVNRNDIRVKEARPLILQKAFRAVEKGKINTSLGTQNYFSIRESKEEDDSIMNFLIRGDNLLSLNSIKKLVDTLPDFKKFKCVYCDVPYNNTPVKT